MPVLVPRALQNIGYLVSERDFESIDIKIKNLYDVIKTERITYQSLDEFKKLLVEYFGSIEKAGFVFSIYILKLRFCKKTGDKIMDLLLTNVRDTSWKNEVAIEIFNWIKYCYPLFEWYRKHGFELRKVMNRTYAVLKYYIINKYGYHDVPKIYISRTQKTKAYFGRSRYYINLYQIIKSIFTGVFEDYKYGIKINGRIGDIDIARWYIIDVLAKYLAYKEGNIELNNIKKHMRELYSVLEKYLR